jgi:hypothetical protein
MSDLTVTKKVQFRRSGKATRPGEERKGRVPRVARLMALAIRFDQLIRDEVVADQAELARLGHVTRARLTQIMNLLNLAADIQEEIMFLGPAPGRERVTERVLRVVAAEMNWTRQRRMWKALSDTR